MIPRGHQSESYRKLLAQQEEEDNERKAKLEELRKKQIREEIKRKREEEDVRKRAQLARERREQAVKQAKVDLEQEQKLKAQRTEEENRKRPLSIAEAKERRERADAARNVKGLAQLKQGLPRQGMPATRPLSSKYSDLLATAPTKLDAVHGKASSPAKLGPKRDSKNLSVLTNGASGRIGSPQKSGSLPSTLTPRQSSLQSSKPVGAMRTPMPPSQADTPTRRQSPFLTTKNTSSVKKNLPSGVMELQPLQKTKRDLRTIEQIQNDIHREKGKEYSYLNKSTVASVDPKRPLLPARQNSSKAVATRPHSTVSKRRAQSPSSESSPFSFSSSSSSQAAPSRRKRKQVVEEDGLGGESIWDILNPGKRRDQYLARDIDSDEDMEANAEDIRREEQRAARAARLEDEREAKLLKEAETRKAAKKRKT